MAKRRVKKRTQIPAQGAGNAGKPSTKPGSRAPKSMVIRVGASEVGSSVSQLVKDVRSMMEPDTASRLQERRSNKLRDYTTMAGPLGVTHLLLFSRSSNGNINLRLAITPRGPTMHFRVEKYSLSKDIFKSMKRPRGGGNEYLVAPLLVMNNFNTQPAETTTTNGDNTTTSTPQVPKHLETLATSVFQSLFPAINPTTTPLQGIKRVLLLDRLPAIPTDPNAAPYVLNLRHYAIETRTAKSVPKALRRLAAAEKLASQGGGGSSSNSTSTAGQKRKRNAMPNLGGLADVSDYLLDPHAADGFTSGSESEPETDAEVEVVAAQARKVFRRKPPVANSSSEGGGGGGGEGGGRGPGMGASATLNSAGMRQPRRVQVERKGIKLHELGPRLKLRLTKVEEGLCAGKVLWHEYINKSTEEVKELEKVHAERRAEKERRRAEQKANVERKRAERKDRGQSAEDGDIADEDAEEDEDGEDLLSEMDDDEWDSDGGMEDDAADVDVSDDDHVTGHAP